MVELDDLLEKAKELGLSKTKEEETKVVEKKKTITEITSDVLKNKELFMVAGKVSSYKIMEQFKIDINKASKIANFIKQTQK